MANETPEQLMARINAQYGVSGNTQPAPQPQAPPQKPAPAPKPEQNKRSLIDNAIGILGGRREQIDKASGYSNGGKIKGVGTPTSDSIPAQVQETGEPIKVSTSERILSAAQDAMLEDMARKSGFESLDAMLEAGTGKPVGPTIKGGKKAAAGGWALDNNPDEYAKAVQEQVLGRDAKGSSPAPAVSPLVNGAWYAGASTADNRTGLEMERDRRAGAASAGVLSDPIKSALQFGVVGGDNAATATGSSASSSPQPAYSNEGRSVPSAVTKPGAGAVVDNEFTQGGKSYTANPTGQQGILRVTAPGTSPLYTNIDPQKAVSGLKDQTIGQPADQEAQGIARTANANRIRGEMIANRDKDIPAGGYAPGILADRSVEDNAALDAMRRSSMISNLSPSQQAEFNMSLSKLALQDKGQQLAADNARYAADVQDKRAAGHDSVIARGQDLTAQNEATRNKILEKESNRKGILSPIAVSGGEVADPSDPMGQRKLKMPNSVYDPNTGTWHTQPQAGQAAGKAPDSAIAMLKSDPKKYGAAFKEKYGYLPEGV